MGVPNFMEGSLISYEIGDPRVPKILGNWGPGSLTSYENGDPGSPFSLDTGAENVTDIYIYIYASSDSTAALHD